jgi:glycosyltransferase involved in cell wall biosynthesis
MKVLVYGEWPKQSKNIKPFFTATYPKEKIPAIRSREFKAPYRFLFVGSLASGKRPIYAMQVISELIKKGFDCKLDLYGEGTERSQIENYIQENQLSNSIKLHGNKGGKVLEEAFKESDFLLLPSQSEGWPKAVAEAMFWGVIPIATKVSCVPWMLREGERGILIEATLEQDVAKIEAHLLNLRGLNGMAEKAQKWSQHYTLDYFEQEIKKLI